MPLPDGHYACFFIVAVFRLYYFIRIGGGASRKVPIVNRNALSGSDRAVDRNVIATVIARLGDQHTSIDTDIHAVANGVPSILITACLCLDETAIDGEHAALCRAADGGVESITIYRIMELGIDRTIMKDNGSAFPVGLPITADDRARHIRTIFHHVNMCIYASAGIEPLLRIDVQHRILDDRDARIRVQFTAVSEDQVHWITGVDSKAVVQIHSFVQDVLLAGIKRSGCIRDGLVIRG